MTDLIKSAAEKALEIANIKATVIVTPSTISIEGIENEKDAETLENAFIKAGMKSLSYVDMAEIGMGEGYGLTIVI